MSAEVLRSLFFLAIGLGLLAIGAYDLRHRRPGWWNRGWPVFYGTGSLFFGALFTLGMTYHLHELLSE